jgi:hypothetical protein
MWKMLCFVILHHDYYITGVYENVGVLAFIITGSPNLIQLRIGEWLV